MWSSWQATNKWHDNVLSRSTQWPSFTKHHCIASKQRSVASKQRCVDLKQHCAASRCNTALLREASLRSFVHQRCDASKLRCDASKHRCAASRSIAAMSRDRRSVASWRIAALLQKSACYPRLKWIFDLTLRGGEEIFHFICHTPATCLLGYQCNLH